MTDINRLYANLVVKLVTDYARENIFGELEIEQDSDMMDYLDAPRKMKLAAGAVATAVSLPIGATTVRFLAVYDVSVATGVRVMLGGAATDPILVVPQDDNNSTGFLLLCTSATSIHVSNPSTTDDVTFKMMIGCD